MIISNKESNIKVAVIIVTFNGAEYIENCIKSIIEGDVIPRVIIVDNNSDDDTIQIIETKFSNVEIIKLTKNYGFGYANNFGIKYLNDNYECNYYFLLNQDTIVFNNTLFALINIAEANTDYGIISPMHFQNDGELDPNFENYIGINREYLNVDKKVGSEIIHTVPMINAAAWLISRACINKVGGFDTSMFFHYGEDTNYCQRVIYHGFKIGFITNTKIIHFRSNKPIINDHIRALSIIMLKKRINMTNLLVTDVESKRIYNEYVMSCLLVFIKSIFYFNFRKSKYLIRQLFSGNILIRKKVVRSRIINRQIGSNWLNMTT